MGDLVLAVDCSTTASKVIAWDREGHAVADARAPLEEIRPTPSESEQVAEGWWDATPGAARGRRRGRRRPGRGPVHHPPARVLRAGRRGEPRCSNAILWDDGRAGAQLAELGERFGHDALHRRTGRGPSLTQAFPKLLWLVQNEPEVAERATGSWTPTATSYSACAAKWTTSLASADSFGLTDVEHDAWAEDLITGIGLRPDQFLATVAPGTVIGEVTASAAEDAACPRGPRSSPASGTARPRASAPA